MGDRIVLFDTMTGEPYGWPDVSGYSWTVGVNDTEGSVEFTTSTAATSAVNTRPWACSVAVLNAAGEVLAGGPIYKRDVDRDKGTVSITAGSFWSFLKKRIFQRDGHPILADNTHYWISTDGTITTYRQTYTSTLGGIACGIVRSQFRDLPGVALFPYPTGNHTRTYDGLELQTVADNVKKLFDDVNPPTVRFGLNFGRDEGRYAFEWTADILGETVQPARHVFSLDSDIGVITSVSVSDDAGAQVNRAWLVSKPPSGNGTESNQSLFAQATRTLEPGEPRMDTADSSHDGVTNGATLDGYAVALANSATAFDMDLTFARQAVTSSGHTTERVDDIKPGDIIVVTNRAGFYGPSTFAGVVQQIAGNQREARVTLGRVSRTEGTEASQTAQPAPAFQRPNGSAASRILELEAFQRRKNNPVTDKPGVPVLRNPVPLTFSSEFENIDLEIVRLDPLGIVVVEGSVRVPSMIVGGGAHTVATLSGSHPITQISVSAFRQGSTSETLQSYVTAGGVLMVRPDPTFYAGNVLVFSGMYSIVS